MEVRETGSVLYYLFPYWYDWLWSCTFHLASVQKETPIVASVAVVQNTERVAEDVAHLRAFEIYVPCILGVAVWQDGEGAG